MSVRLNPPDPGAFAPCDGALVLGGALNLLAGLRPVFAPAHLPWQAPAQVPIKTEPVTAPSDPVDWGDPVLSLHHGVADLLGGIFDYRANPMANLDGPLAIDAGPVMTWAGADLDRFAHDLGITLGNHTYLLARITGRRRTVYFQPESVALNRKHKIIDWLTPKGRKAMARLRLKDMRRAGPLFHGDVTARQTQRYLEYFEQMGTHILGGVTFGDMLHQVFQVDDDQAAALIRIFDQEARGGPPSGGAAFGLRPFTRQPWITQTSAIMSASAGQVARAVCSDPIWQGGDGAAPSLLNPAARDGAGRRAVLERLPAQTAVAAEFVSQALYMEDFRAEAWSRVLRGALSHRFAGLTQTGWQQRDAFAPVSFLQSAGLGGTASLCASPSAEPPGLSFALDLDAPLPPLSAQGDYLALCACARPASGATLRCDADWPGFDPWRFKVPFVDGAFEVRLADDDPATLIDGAWLGKSLADDLAVVADPADVPAEHLLRHKDTLADYVRLLMQLRGPIFGPDVNAFAIRCATWLAGQAKRDAALHPLAWDATWVALGDGWDLADPASDHGLLRKAARAAVSLMALGPDMAAVETGAKALAAEVAALYRAGLGQRCAALAIAGTQYARAVATGCATWAQTPGLSDVTRSALSAGSDLLSPPDHTVLPHAPLTGAHPVPRLLNGIMTLRTHVAKTRAVLAACTGDPATAVETLRGEPMPPRLVSRDPAADIMQAIEELGGDVACAGDALWAAVSDLGKTGRAATLIHRTDVADPALARCTCEPQMLRLIVVLDLLNLCQMSGVSLAPLVDLTPAAIVSRLETVLQALPD